jgi:hypothetical protein
MHMRDISEGLCFVMTLLVAVTPFPAPAAAAKPPGTDGWMIRMLACEGESARMELYLPQSVVFGDRAAAESFASHRMQPGQPVIGYYALDLTDANKGKSLEPVRVTLSADKKTVIVDQYTRGLPPTRIPVGGGTVDFDQRFGTAAKCGPFQSQDPDYGNRR